MSNINIFLIFNKFHRELENHDGDEESEELKDQLAKLRVKLEHKKQELGRKTRDVSAKERVVDQIPSRAELSQYQKRFLELYKQGTSLFLSTKTDKKLNIYTEYFCHFQWR